MHLSLNIEPTTSESIILQKHNFDDSENRIVYYIKFILKISICSFLYVKAHYWKPHCKNSKICF